MSENTTDVPDDGAEPQAEPVVDLTDQTLYVDDDLSDDEDDDLLDADVDDGEPVDENATEDDAEDVDEG